MKKKDGRKNYLKFVGKVSNQLLCFAFATSLKMAYLGTNLKTAHFNCPKQVQKQPPRDI